MPRLTNRAKKDLGKLPSNIASKAHAIIERLDDDPTLGRKLLGALRGKRSARLGRSHRIIYTAATGDVIVLTIGPRRDVYR